MTKRERVVAAAAAVGIVSLALSIAYVVLRRAESDRGVDLELAQTVSADFGARVEELLYRGAASRATLRAGDRTWIAEGEVGPLRPGDATMLSWRAEDLRVVGR